METNLAYQNYIADTKNLETTQGRLNAQRPYAKDFEEIYSNAMEEDVNLSTAQNYIENLSKSELGVIQKYNGLADAIDSGSLSAEAAYNLVVHDNEQYDFNRDGSVQVGAANIIPAVPATMPSDVRVAYIDGLNALDGVDKLMAMTLTFDMGRIIALANNTPYVPQTIDYEYLSNQVEARLHPQGGAITSQSTKESTRVFWETFQNAYTGEATTSTEEERDPAIEKFLEKLRIKGASTFLAELYMEKIEKKIEEYRDKLVKKMGDSPESMVKIEELVSQYKNQLLEESQANLDNDDKDKQTLDAQAMVQIMLNLKTEESTPLEKLLQEKV